MKRFYFSLILILMLTAFTFVIHAGTVTHTYTFDEPQVQTINGQFLVVLDNARTWGKTGAPLLPQTALNLLLPPGEEALSISVETPVPVILGTGYQISPMQPHYPLSQGPQIERVQPDPLIYSSNDPYPGKIWDNLQTQYLCGHSLGYAILHPVTYRPVSGEIAYYPWIKVTLQTQTTAKAQQIQANMLKRSQDIQERVIAAVQNPEMNAIYGAYTPTDPETYDQLAIMPADFVVDYQEYFDYKNCSGIKTKIITTEEIYNSYTGQDNQEQIRNCIIDYYETYDITYVFLCGDNEHIPARSFWCVDDNLPADLYYAGLDGNWNNDNDELWGEPGEEDLVAEVFVGRSCADNPEEIANFVNKAMMYQIQPVVDEVETALMTGEDLGWSIWAWEYKEEIRLGSNSWGYSTVGFPGNFDVGTLYEYPGSFWSATGDLLPLLNEGPTLVNHLGHANWDYVMKFGRGQINDDNFTNDGVNHNYFIGYSQGCICGDFTHFIVDCILEMFTTIEHGAVAFIGNSRYGWGSYNTTNGPSQHFDREFFDALFGEGIYTIGWTQQDSKEDNAWAVPGDDIMRWCYYCLNLFGDPTMEIWTEAPQTFTPEYASAVLAGATTFEVTNIAVEGALITISLDNEILGRGTANASGVATVNFGSPIADEGEMTLMVTAHNMLPFEGEVLAIPGSGPYVIFSDYAIEDDVTGNGNSQLDYSETVGLTVDMENVGAGNALGVELTLETNDPLITISDDTEVLGDLLSSTIGTVENAFEFEVVPEVEDGYEVEFILTATDGDSTWVSDFTILAHAPVLVYTGLYIDDPAGNANSLLDPGETADLEITISNEGTSDAEELSIVLTCSDPLITITGDPVQVANLNAGSETTVEFTVQVDEQVMQGSKPLFTIDLTTESGYAGQQEFSVTVGDMQYRPIGPDTYGYYAYDSYDGLEAPVYQWEEIAPVAGGPGTNLQLGDEETQLLDLPFTFKFYGSEFDQITVCSQGWISFDVIDMFYPLNICIPHIVPPDNAVYALWDEWDPGQSGQVCTWYDQANNRYVVEWFMVPHRNDPTSSVSFEIFLYDPEYTGTTSGDGEIIVNYQYLNSNLNLCTIGIENGTATDGIQYLHNGNYHDYAMALEEGLAIRYTTEGNPVGVKSAKPHSIPDEFALQQNYPNPFNPSTAIRYQLPLTSHVKLQVYDVTGRQVASLIDGWRNAGYHEITFDAVGLTSGVYIYRLTTGRFTATGKMVLMK